MLQNPCKTLGFKKNMVYKIPPGGGGKPYPASGLLWVLKRTVTMRWVKKYLQFYAKIFCLLKPVFYTDLISTKYD